MIQFLAAFGNEAHTVSLSKPNGSGANYQIMVSGRFWGQIVRVFEDSRYRWKAYLTPKDLTSADQQVLEDIVQEHDPVENYYV